MQRRWAAVCLAFFLVTAAGAYGASAIAEGPELDLEGDTYQHNDTFEANGTTYTVAVSGGSGSLVYNETVSNEETFANNTAIEYDDGSYNVSIESGEDPSGFALVEQFDAESLLVNDSAVENQTYTADDGSAFVRYRNETTQPLEAYLPEPDRETFSEGDTLQHAGNSKTVENVTSESVVVTWEAEEEQSLSLAQGENVTVDDTQYVATFPSDDTVKLSEDVAGYQQYDANRQYFQQRLSGLNYVMIFSLGAAFLLTALSFLPRRG